MRARVAPTGGRCELCLVPEAHGARLALEAEHADAAGREEEAPAEGQGLLDPAGAQHAQDVAVGEDRDVAVDGQDLARRPGRSARRRRPPSRRSGAVPPQKPPRAALADLRRRDALVVAVVPLEEVVATSRRSPARPGAVSRARPSGLESTSAKSWPARRPASSGARSRPAPSAARRCARCAGRPRHSVSAWRTSQTCCRNGRSSFRLIRRARRRRRGLRRSRASSDAGTSGIGPGDQAAASAFAAPVTSSRIVRDSLSLSSVSVTRSGGGLESRVRRPRAARMQHRVAREQRGGVAVGPMPAARCRARCVELLRVGRRPSQPEVDRGAGARSRPGAQASRAPGGASTPGSRAGRQRSSPLQRWTSRHSEQLSSEQG